MDCRDLDHIEVPPMTDTPFKQIWDWQEALVKEYNKIEGRPDVQYPLNLDLKENQNLIKDFIGRVVEELAEAYEWLMSDKPDLVLAKEELADALHFMVELLIFSHPKEGYHQMLAVHDPLKDFFENQEIPPPFEMGSEPWAWSVVRCNWGCTFHLNLARNALRNKPWKQTEVRANPQVYFHHLASAFSQLWGLFYLLGCDVKEVYSLYYKKNQVNWFRIKSKY